MPDGPPFGQSRLFFGFLLENRQIFVFRPYPCTKDASEKILNGINDLEFQGASGNCLPGQEGDEDDCVTGPRFAVFLVKAEGEKLRDVTETIQEMVYIVDDERIARFHLNAILRTEGYVSECFESGEEFLAAVPSSACGCALLDVSLAGGIDGQEIHRRIAERKLALSVIFVTAHVSVPLAVDVMKQGAADMLIKPASRESLIPAVERALAMAAQMRRRLLEQEDIGALAKQLTDREKEVLSWIVAGKLNKEVAYYLGITERTVKAHRASIMEKLGMVSVPELVRFADRVGLSRQSDS